MTIAGDQAEYLPLFVYGTRLERPIRDAVLGQSVLRTECAAARGRWKGNGLSRGIFRRSGLGNQR
jgi:hypothetical protein